MRNECALLIGAMAASVAGKPLNFEHTIDWSVFVKLCQFHAVVPLVYDGLRKAGMLDAVPQETQQFMSRAYYEAIFRDMRFDVLMQAISERLVHENIPHIFLKGACLKHDYPIPALRTMADLDMLVHVEDFARLDRLSLELNATAGHSDGNHRCYYFPGDLTVEFHPNLLHQDVPVGTGLNPGWQYAKKDMPTSAGALTEEGFYLNTICHLANHFVLGGVGVRFVSDVWVNRNLRKAEIDRTFVEKELQRFGLLEFAQNIEALAEYWFGNGECSALLEELGAYILTSGIHGVAKREVLNAIALSPKQSRISALMKKVFYSRDEMECRYPWCKDKPWLLPAAWCARAYRAITKHHAQISRWSKKTRHFTKKEIENQREKLKRFGIQR